MGWLRLVGSLKVQVSFAKEPYKSDGILQKRHLISRSLLIVATPYQQQRPHTYTHIHRHDTHTHTSTDMCVAVCCSALQCVAVRCSVLQRVAACWWRHHAHTHTSTNIILICEHICRCAEVTVHCSELHVCCRGSDTHTHPHTPTPTHTHSHTHTHTHTHTYTSA